MKLNFIFLIMIVTGIICMCLAQQGEVNRSSKSDKKTISKKPHILIKTSMGEIEVELYREKAPVSVNNFLDYVNSTFYDNTVFHRVICNFMIQGGGFKENLVRKETRAPIPYEGDNGLSNLRGTISYARTADPNSATSQFFINHRDNFGLDHGNTRDGYGYAVFGKVVRGMDVVDQIASVKTGTRPNGMQDVPIKPVKIYHIRLIDNK